MAQTQTADSGLVQRGLLLLGGMAALVVVVLLIALRDSSSSRVTTPSRTPLLMPVCISMAPFPATLGWSLLAPMSEQLPSSPGWEIRYNAAAALARRGSSQTPWPVIREMLDPQQQLRNFVTLKNGQIFPHEEEAQRTIHSTLAALTEWHRKQDRAAKPTIPADLQAVYAQVDRLAESGNTLMRVQADRARQTFFRQ